MKNRLIDIEKYHSMGKFAKKSETYWKRTEIAVCFELLHVTKEIDCSTVYLYNFLNISKILR